MFKRATIAGKRPFLKWTNCYEEIQIKKVPMRDSIYTHLPDMFIPSGRALLGLFLVSIMIDLTNFLSLLKKLNLYALIDIDYKVLGLILLIKNKYDLKVP